MQKTEEATPDRRNFLRMAAMSGPAAVAAAATMTVGEAQAKPVDFTSDRLQDTEHTRAYYDSARF